MTLQDIKNYIIARIFPNTSQAITGATMQDTLLQMAESMNTPSGDPLHGWFTSIGGVYNSDTNLWSLLGVENMTSADMLEVAKLGTNRIYPTADLNDYSSLARVIVGKKNSLINTSAKAVKMANFLANNLQVEVVQLSTYDIYSNYDYPIYTTSMGYAFYACAKLRIVRNRIDVSGTPAFTSSFTQCSALEILRLQGLKASLSLADSPINVDSATFILQNANDATSFTITFRADRQAIFEADADFVNAKNAKPNITILYQ